jgi:putative transposase
MASPIIRLENVQRTYHVGDVDVHALRDVSLIGSIRRECLDHIIIFNEHHLRRVLSSYFQYHHQTRTHLSLDKDCPETRPTHPPTAGKIIAFPQVGGLHHRYERRAA